MLRALGVLVMLRALGVFVMLRTLVVLVMLRTLGVLVMLRTLTVLVMLKTLGVLGVLVMLRTLGDGAAGVARGDLEFVVADTGNGAVSRAGTAGLEDWDAASSTFVEVVAVVDVRPGVSRLALRDSRDSGEEERGREDGQSLESELHLDTGWTLVWVIAQYHWADIH
jgi:hypothetical protein